MLGLMVVFSEVLGFDVPMVMAFAGAIMITGGVFPVDLGLKFDPNVPPGITVPEWHTGLYAFLRTMYDKFVTGVLWPGLFIFALLIVHFRRSIQEVLMEGPTDHYCSWYHKSSPDYCYNLLGFWIDRYSEITT